MGDVAREIDAGERTVQRWAARLGLARRRGQRGPGEPGPVAQEAIGRLLAGEEVRAVAGVLGVSEARIRQIRASITDGDERK